MAAAFPSRQLSKRSIVAPALAYIAFAVGSGNRRIEPPIGGSVLRGPRRRKRRPRRQATPRLGEGDNGRSVALRLSPPLIRTSRGAPGRRGAGNLDAHVYRPTPMVTRRPEDRVSWGSTLRSSSGVSPFHAILALAPSVLRVSASMNGGAELSSADI